MLSALHTLHENPDFTSCSAVQRHLGMNLSISGVGFRLAYSKDKNGCWPNDDQKSWQWINSNILSSALISLSSTFIFFFNLSSIHAWRQNCVSGEASLTRRTGSDDLLWFPPPPDHPGDGAPGPPSRGEPEEGGWGVAEEGSRYCPVHTGPDCPVLRNHNPGSERWTLPAVTFELFL